MNLNLKQETWILKIFLIKYIFLNILLYLFFSLKQKYKSDSHVYVHATLISENQLFAPEVGQAYAQTNNPPPSPTGGWGKPQLVCACLFP